MISAWDIYWVMQIDDIVCLLFILGFLVGASAMASWWAGMESLSRSSTREKAPLQHKKARKLGIISVMLLAVASLLPSTKTAAMMLVIPTVVNSQPVQKEATELYTIAKDALRELAKPDLPTAKQAAEEPE